MYEFRIQMPMWLALDDAATRAGQSKAVFVREAIDQHIRRTTGADLVAEYAPLALEHTKADGKKKTRKRPLPPAARPLENSARCLHCDTILTSLDEAPQRCACTDPDQALIISGGPLFLRRQYGPASRWQEADGSLWMNGREWQTTSTETSATQSSATKPQD